MSRNLLTIEALITAQRRIIATTDNETQRSRAQEQLSKLEAMRNFSMASNIGNSSLSPKVEESLSKITKPKGDALNVTLGDLRKEFNQLRKEFKDCKKTFGGCEPTAGRAELPVANFKHDNESQEKRIERLVKIGELIEKRTVLAKGNSAPDIVTSKNKDVYERFISETKKRDLILQEATEQQLDIFQRIEETLIKLREAGTEDSKALREELAALAGELEATPDNKAKEKITPILNNSRITSTIGSRGQDGNFADFVQALLGKRTVLKDGYQYDSRRGIVNTKTGKLAKREDAIKGRFASAGTILNSALGNMADQYIETKRSETIQRFFDNFRSTTEKGDGTVPIVKDRGQQISELQAQQYALQEGANPITNKVNNEKHINEGDRSSTANSSESIINTENVTVVAKNIKGNNSSSIINEGDSSVSIVSSSPTINSNITNINDEKEKETEVKIINPKSVGANIINIASNVVNLKEKKPQPKETVKPIQTSHTDPYADSGSRTPNKIATPLNPNEMGEEGSGDFALGALLGSLATGLSALVTTIGSLLLKLAPWAAAAGVVKGVDTILGETTNIGKDEFGNEITINKRQDDENWKKMSPLQKAESAIPRGIEKVSGYIAPNLTKEMQRSRVNNETNTINPKPINPSLLAPIVAEMPIKGISDIPKKTGIFKTNEVKELPLDQIGIVESKSNLKETIPNKIYNNNSKVSQDVIDVLDERKDVKMIESTQSLFDNKKIENTEDKKIDASQIFNNQNIQNNSNNISPIENKINIAPRENLKLVPSGSSYEYNKRSNDVTNNSSTTENNNVAPIIINNNQVINPATNSTQIIAPRGKVRGEESNIDAYFMRTSHFF